MGTALTFSADARFRGGTALAEKVDNFPGSGASALFTSNAAWAAAPMETSQTVRMTSQIHRNKRVEYMSERDSSDIAPSSIVRDWIL